MHGSRRKPVVEKFQVGDIRIACRRYGSGPPLLMITGYGVTMDLWDRRLIHQLAAGHRVIVFDNRGMGKTSGGTRPWSIDLFAGDAAGLIEALGYDSVSVLGWSLGGDVSLDLAVEFPDKVSRLIVYAGDCGGPQKVPAPKYRKVLKKTLRGAHVPFEQALAILFPPEWMKSHPDYWRTLPVAGEVSQLFKLPGILRQNDAYEDLAGVYEDLPEIRCPTLIVTGTEDVSTPPENAHILARRIAGSRLVLFEGAGHGLMYQFPARLAAVILDFLSEPPVQPAEPGGLLEGSSTRDTA